MYIPLLLLIFIFIYKTLFRIKKYVFYKKSMATNLNKLFVFVPTASTDTYKSTTGLSADYLNKIAFLQGTGEIMTKGQVFAINSSEDVAALKTKIGQESSSWKAFADGITATDVIGAINQVKALVDANTTSIGNSTSGLTKRVADLETSVDTTTTGLKDRMTAAEGKLTTLIGSYTGMSIKEIAAGEVALIVDNSPAAFDTLKEIADWIGSGDVENTTAATMLTDITTLKTKVGAANTAAEGQPSNASGIYKDIEDIKGELLELNGGAGSISSQIDAKVALLDSSVTLAGTTASQPSTVARNTSIDVLGSITISETDGKIDAEANGKSAKVVLQADAAGAAQKAYEDLLGTSSDANDGSVITLHGIKNYADAIVANKNVSASGDSFVSASASGNAVTVAATASTIASLGKADTAIQSVTLQSTNTTYITVSGSADGQNVSGSFTPVMGTLTNNNTGTSVLSYTAGLASTQVVADAINAIEVWETIS